MASTPFPLRIEDAFSVKDKVAIVTGAAGSIGSGIAHAFAINGAKVVCSDRPTPDLDHSVAGIAVEGADAVAIPADLRKPEDLKQLIDASVAKFGGLDVLINCGGIPGSRPISDEDVDAFDRLYQTNVRALWLLTRHAIVPMSQRGGGSIVNIASINGHRAVFPCSLYSGTKAAVLATTRDLATELAPHGIRVNSVSPGAIADPALRFQQLLAQINEPWRSEFAGQFGHLAREVQTLASQPLPIAGSKYDIAMACLYLCTPAARFVTGADLVVDGGRLQEMPEFEARCVHKPDSPWRPAYQKLRQLPDAAWTGQRPPWTRPAPPQASQPAPAPSTPTH